MPVFSEEQKRQIRDYHPSLGDRPPGIDLAAILEARDAQIASGTATIPAAAAFVDVVVGAAFDDKPAVATLGFVDATATVVANVVWTAGTLRISANAAATLDTIVHWMVDGR